MARLIFLSPYLKGSKNAAHLINSTRYFATREGVEFLQDEGENLLVTQKQNEYIKRLIRSFPQAKQLAEYEEFQGTPSRKTASEFISEAHENFVEPMTDRENYLDYIANRPGVKSLGEHGLWGVHGKVQNLESVAQEVAHHDGTVWLPIISLPRESAERLGYCDVENWQNLIFANLTQLAKAYKIKPKNLRWYAALHEKPNNFHVHMIVYSTDPIEGFLTKQGIRDIKSALVRTVYQNERIHVYEQKSEQRNLVQKSAQTRMNELISQLENGELHSEKLEQLTAELAERLQNCNGKKVYGYLPPRTKRIVDEIVDELAKDERVKQAYELWQNLREQLSADYSDTPMPRVPLNRQKDFKSVRNMVIREVLKLGENDFEFENEQSTHQNISHNYSPQIAFAVQKMLNNLAHIFRENSAETQVYRGMKLDRKRRKQLAQKRMVLGHKTDDYDGSGLYEQT